MTIRLDPTPLRHTRWYGHLLRFAVGGAVTVATGLVGKAFGPVIGGLFLAFPAIFPVSLAMMEKVENEKIGVGARGHHAHRAALVEAVGAATGSLGLLAFAGIAWSALARLPTAAALALAALAWTAAALLGWGMRRRWTRRRPSRARRA